MGVDHTGRDHAAGGVDHLPPRGIAQPVSVLDPTAAITSPVTATVPPTSTSRAAFMVTTSPPVTSSVAEAGEAGTSRVA